MLAFHILAHRSPEHLRHLVEAIQGEHATVLIHIDRKSPPDVHAAAKGLADRFSGVHVQPAREVRWGGWSTVQVELEGMRWLLDHGSWSHYLLLSGMDFPLVAADRLAEVLATAPDTSWMLSFDPPERWEHHRRRVEPVWREPKGAGEVRRSARRFDRDFLLGGRPWLGGSQWVNLARSHCEAAVDRYRTWNLRLYFRWSLLADESYLPTALVGHVDGRITNSNQRYLRFPPGEPHPKVLGLDDLEHAFASDAWFARKLDVTGADDATSVEGRMLASLLDHLAVAKVTLDP